VPDQSFSLPELPISLLFSTARPSSTGEKLVFYKLVRAVVSRPPSAATPGLPVPTVGASRGDLLSAERRGQATLAERRAILASVAARIVAFRSN
jgi:hypothetical protein